MCQCDLNFNSQVTHDAAKDQVVIEPQHMKEMEGDIKMMFFTKNVSHYSSTFWQHFVQLLWEYFGCGNVNGLGNVNCLCGRVTLLRLSTELLPLRLYPSRRVSWA
jgi:hypothetical protein